MRTAFSEFPRSDLSDLLSAQARGSARRQEFQEKYGLFQARTRPGGGGGGVCYRNSVCVIAIAGDGAVPTFVLMNVEAQVPYIEDPNTGAKMFESAEIIDYLRATYAA